MRRVGLGFLLGLVAQAFLFTLSLEGFTLLAPICEGSLEGFSLLAPICEGNLEGFSLLAPICEGNLERFSLLAPICEGNLEGPVPWVCFSPRVLVAGHWSLVADILSA